MVTTTLTPYIGGVAQTPTTTSYTYNDRGLRVSASAGGTTTADLCDPSTPTGYAQVLEQFVNAVLTKSFTLGHDVTTETHHAGPADAGTAHTFLHDGHGSTRLLMLGLSVHQQYAYTAFGVMLEGAGLTNTVNALTRLLYAGEHTNPNGTQYLRARWYTPSTGTFNRPDPYAGNNSDPLLGRWLAKPQHKSPLA